MLETRHALEMTVGKLHKINKDTKYFEVEEEREIQGHASLK